MGNDFKISPEDFPTLLLSLKKSNHYEYLKYSIYNIQAQFTKENSLLIPIENEYIYGKIPYEQDGYSRYELTRINTLYKYMRIEFSSNYDKIDFTLNYHKSIESAINYYKNNTNFVKSEFYNGKTEIIIELKDDNIIRVYLSVFNTENSHVNKEKKYNWF